MPYIIPNLHPLVVHFPVALITIAAIFHLVAAVTRSKTCAVIAHTSLWLGALGAVIAVLFGWQAYNSVNHDEAGHAAMLLHRAWALGTLAVVVTLAAWDGLRRKADDIPSKWFSTAIVIAWGLVAVTAWHGGELVYRHGLGVMALPIIEEGHHHHGDGDDASHTHAADHPEPADHEHDHHEH
ncbi:uncharacterized protein NMK_2372 [Novimethylophilus kurashikiensis]|uniref:DUF2231 domain-containing protein n=1 Tax=Novimethylophilus kurashikiensis TaxID=1825523 RepID=A0A2R5FDV0_9PROT|nr:DUF2231 domain-containing protein [Novimethylophilus kurashikiensis]GBG14771.1 uncharacterized protein NMK_2372 [Novimethylophilus kurashikiensis]